ncbi:alpha/beta hydrolase [Acinetobacter qingfengensis]|uniref:Serine aminopeptidase S33 domain-containing protein n=1 Tax=Acinetobacter qingfengensis TaxID=1262585 RepID=A0A1E7RFK0_9GAMM|nr:alpha/beta hydrolase [Acinetobacter qingfengensis]KAA8735614.1 alpha/beta hydrolase [Acinetobacter qingfengensis]OEY97935.1 hypothetical protein BJI46_07670 [Acinetobacter qingfengensis]
MATKRPLLLIHGTWCTSKCWGDFVPQLQQLGFDVYAPSLRYHELAFSEMQNLVATVSLQDYIFDLEEILLSFDQPAIVVGHSLGGLLAQLLVAKHPEQCCGMILLGTAPMAGIYALYPTMIASFYQHFLRWGFWKKPLLPNKKTVQKYVMNRQSASDQQQFFAKLVAESGRVYAEMALWFLDPGYTAQVNTQAVDLPVLVISGTDDKVVVDKISQTTAQRYRQSTCVILQGADHMYIMGETLPKTMIHIRQWMIQNHILK